MARFAAALGFFHPGLTVLTFPAWDCLPYDRVSPNGEIASRRIDTLTRLAGGGEDRAADRADHGQRAGAAGAAAQPVRGAGADARPRRAHPARPAAELFPQQRLFPHRHRARAGRVRRPRRHRRPLPGGRGAAGAARFLRRHARKPAQLRSAEPALDRRVRRRWCCGRSARCCSTTRRSSASARRYRELFGNVGGDDALYESVSAGRRYAGMEHWLPLYYESLETLFDYLPGAAVSFD